MRLLARSRLLLLRRAARIEQRVRAQPRLYAAAYSALERYPRLSSLIRRVRAQVPRPDAPSPIRRPADSPFVEERREAAVAAMLGLHQ